MAAETGAAGTALVKWLGATVILGSIAAVLGFMVLPPRSWEETLKRLFVTICFSALLGPLLFYSFLSWQPDLLPTAVKYSALSADHVRDVLKAPFYVIGGWPGWWMSHWFIRALEKRKDKDAVEVAAELKDLWKK